MTTNDLQQMSQLLDEKLEQKFNEKLEPIYKELKNHSKMLRSLKKTQDTMLEVLDRE